MSMSGGRPAVAGGCTDTDIGGAGTADRDQKTARSDTEHVLKNGHSTDGYRRIGGLK